MPRARTLNPIPVYVATSGRRILYCGESSQLALAHGGRQTRGLLFPALELEAKLVPAAAPAPKASPRGSPVDFLTVDEAADLKGLASGGGVLYAIHAKELKGTRVRNPKTGRMGWHVLRGDAEAWTPSVRYRRAK